MANQSVLVVQMTEENEFQVVQAQSAIEEGKKQGIPVQVIYGGLSAAAQTDAINRNVLRKPPAERPGAVIVETAGNDLAAVAERVVAEGVGWAAINQHGSELVSRLRRQYPRLPIFKIGANNEAIGQLQAQLAIQKLPPKNAGILYITGPSTANFMGVADERSKGFRALIKPLEGPGKLSVTSFMGTWTKESGIKAIEMWLMRPNRHPVSIIVSQNDDMLIGALTAIEKAKATELMRLPCIGVDAGSTGREMVRLKKFLATVKQPTSPDEAIRQLVGFWKHNRPIAEEVLLKPTVVQ